LSNTFSLVIGFSDCAQILAAYSTYQDSNLSFFGNIDIFYMFYHKKVGVLLNIWSLMIGCSYQAPFSHITKINKMSGHTLDGGMTQAM
jgi:hypothetical protein